MSDKIKEFQKRWEGVKWVVQEMEFGCHVANERDVQPEQYSVPVWGSIHYADGTIDVNRKVNVAVTALPDLITSIDSEFLETIAKTLEYYAKKDASLCAFGQASYLCTADYARELASKQRAALEKAMNGGVE